MISVQTLLSRHGGNLLSDLVAQIFIDFNALLFCTILRVCVCVCASSQCSRQPDFYSVQHCVCEYALICIVCELSEKNFCGHGTFPLGQLVINWGNFKT